MKKCILGVLILFSACEEEITLDINQESQTLVVEGGIEPGFPPYVILTRNQGYFDPINVNTYEDLFIKEAEIKVWTNNLDGSSDSINLTLISDSTPFFTDLDYFNSPNNYEFSKTDRKYYLEIKWNNHTITSMTTIPEITPLDSLWVKQNPNTEADWWKESTCDIWSVYSDDASIQNNILIRSKRLEHWKRTSHGIVNIEDPNLLLFDCGSDILINGESFETVFLRPNPGSIPPLASYQSERYEINNNQDSVFLPPDVVLIKFCQIDESSMRFWRSVVRQVTINGNPVSEPMNLVSNINGGLGIWTGYAPVYYKVPIVKDTVIFNQYIPGIDEIF